MSEFESECRMQDLQLRGELHRVNTDRNKLNPALEVAKRHMTQVYLCIKVYPLLYVPLIYQSYTPDIRLCKKLFRPGARAAVITGWWILPDRCYFLPPTGSQIVSIYFELRKHLCF